MELKKSNKLGKYQYKRVAFEITDATSFTDIAYVFEKYPELTTFDNTLPSFIVTDSIDEAEVS